MNLVHDYPMLLALGIFLARIADVSMGTVRILVGFRGYRLLAAVIVRDRKSGASARYTVADEWMARIAEWNKTLDPAGRYQAVMAAPGLFEVTVTP